eukprot:1173387-Prorocentrum_minimum.AAC.1
MRLASHEHRRAGVQHDELLLPSCREVQRRPRLLQDGLGGDARRPHGLTQHVRMASPPVRRPAGGREEPRHPHGVEDERHIQPRVRCPAAIRPRLATIRRSVSHLELKPPVIHRPRGNPTGRRVSAGGGAVEAGTVTGALVKGLQPRGEADDGGRGGRQPPKGRGIGIPSQRRWRRRRQGHKGGRREMRGLGTAHWRGGKRCVRARRNGGQEGAGREAPRTPVDTSRQERTAPQVHRRRRG